MSEMEEMTLEARIVDAAYYCFDKYGFDKTTIGDISDKAKVARSTFYKFYKNKDAIILDICYREIINETLEAQKILERQADYQEALIEIVRLVVRAAQSNDYIRYILESDHALRVVATCHLQEGSDVAERLKSIWIQALRPFIENKKVGSITMEEAISWLNFGLIVLLKKVDMLQLSDDQLNRFIRHFIVKPVFAN